MAQERSGAATVLAQEGERLQVDYRGQRLSVPMRGFPPGFALRPGTRVILVDEPSGTVARPLVRAITTRVPVDVAERRGAIELEGRRLEMQPSTVLEQPRPLEATRPSDEAVVWVMERGDAQPPDQVIAVRRRGR
jgi:hypothetical protein